MAAETKKVEFDPALVAEMIEWREVPPTSPSDLTKMITYVMTASGIRAFRKAPFGMVIEEAKEPIGGIQGVLPPSPPLGVVLDIPKIPFTILQQVVSFFREVWAKHKSEALVRIFFDREATTWHVHVPRQDVSSGGVQHQDDFDKEGKLLHVADIHSHCTMSAFFSSTDDADEKKAVRLYGVIGKINDISPASNWRAWSGKEFIKLSIREVVELPDDEVTYTFRLGDFITSNAVDGKNELTLKLTGDKVDLFKAEFPPEWLKQVGEKKFHGQHHQQGSFPASGIDRRMGPDDHPDDVVGGEETDYDGMWPFWAKPVGLPGETVKSDRPHAKVASSDGEKINEMARNIAKVQTDKLVYIVNTNGDVYRVKDDGHRVLTAMRPPDLAKQQQGDKKDRTVVFAVLPTDGSKK